MPPPARSDDAHASTVPAFTGTAPAATDDAHAATMRAFPPIATPSPGTPDAALDVPATRPSTMPPTRPSAHAASDRPIPQLPLTKKQLLIAGSALFGLIVVIALAASGGKKSSGKPVIGTTTGSTTMGTSSDDAVAPTIERAKALIASEDYEAAIDMLKTARKANPQNAELAFLAGKAYFGQLYWTDGIDSFRSAIKLDPSYRENDELLKTVLKGFLTTPDIDDRIAGFIERDLKDAMRPYLQETADTHPKKNLRARARAELERL
jgi:tetratricopeptide (TPR) repeat protein